MDNQKGFALVTGGSRGIGAAVCAVLARAGFDIAVNYVSNKDAAEATAEICRGFGVRAEIFRADVASAADCEAMVKDACAALGTLAVLVNNAGITRDTLLLRMSEEQFDAVIDGNLKGTFHLMRLAAPLMVKARAGRIINMTSPAGISGNAGQCNYSAAKAGIIGLTKSAAKELGARSITVNAVAPGFTETDMTSGLPDKVKSAALERTSLRRFAAPEEIAATVGFLASPEAGYITGQVIQVDGGLVL